MTALFDEMARKDLLSRFNERDFQYTGTPLSQLEVKEISSKTAREYIATFHYSKTYPDSTLYNYGAYLNGIIIGVVCYGMGCAKEQYISVKPDIQNGEYIELTRLWVAKDMPKNTESKIISSSLKLLPPSIKLVLSFADESMGHCGIIYQATNWYYLGKNNGGKMLVMENGIKKHTRLLGVYRMRHPEYKDLTNDELMEKLGLSYDMSGRKHKYVYLRGNKKDKKMLFSYIKDKIKPYPKIDKKCGLSEKEIVENEKIDYKQLTFL